MEFRSSYHYPLRIICLPVDFKSLCGFFGLCNTFIPSLPSHFKGTGQRLHWIRAFFILGFLHAAGEPSGGGRKWGWQWSSPWRCGSSPPAGPPLRPIITASDNPIEGTASDTSSSGAIEELHGERDLGFRVSDALRFWEVM